MIIERMTIKNQQGLHMRPAGVLAKAVTKYPCDVKIIVGEKEVNAKSIMNIIGACIKCGMDIEVKCNGEQEEEAMATVRELVESGFGE